MTSPENAAIQGGRQDDAFTTFRNITLMGRMLMGSLARRFVYVSTQCEGEPYLATARSEGIGAMLRIPSHEKQSNNRCSIKLSRKS